MGHSVGSRLLLEVGRIGAQHPDPLGPERLQIPKTYSSLVGTRVIQYEYLIDRIGECVSNRYREQTPIVTTYNDADNFRIFHDIWSRISLSQLALEVTKYRNDRSKLGDRPRRMRSALDMGFDRSMKISSS